MELATKKVVGSVNEITGYVPQQQQPPQSQPEPQLQQPAQSDLPKGWTEQVDPATGIHIYTNGVTTQQTPVKPPNEVLPDGWTHVYYEEYQRFAYMELATKRVVGSVNEIKSNDAPVSQQQPQQPIVQQQQNPQDSLPKGWVEWDQNGVHWYGNGATRQQTTVKPPNEILPDGWTHVYYEQYQRFGYMELATKKVVGSVNDITGYVPH